MDKLKHFALYASKICTVATYISVRQADKRIACEEEFSDSEDEDGGRKDRRDHKKKRQKTDAADKKEGETGNKVDLKYGF